MILSTQQIANFFNVSDRAVRLWSERGCPKLRYGQWDLNEVHAWWLENIYQAENDDDVVRQAKGSYWAAKARVEMVKADVADGTVIKIEDFKQAWVWRVSEMSNGLGALPMRVAPLLAGKNEEAIRDILDAEIRKIRDTFARTGKFTPDTSNKPAKKSKAKRKRR